MTYRVDISPQAISDIENAYAFILESSPQSANQWFLGILDAIYTLEKFPKRCPLAPESRSFIIEVRQLLYGKRRQTYRILFGISVDEDTQTDVVLIYRVRHTAQKYLEGFELLGKGKQ